MYSRKQRRTNHVQRYDLALRIKSKDDIRNVPRSIDEISAKLDEDDFLSGLIACGELKGNILRLRSCNPDRKSDIEQNIPRIKKLFGVDMEPVKPKYLLLVVGAQNQSDFEITPERICKLHCVTNVKLYRKCANWYLQLSSLDDALSLARRRSVFLGGNKSPFEVKPITGHFFECFKCSAAGHYQDQCKSEVQICGKCAGRHETRQCNLKEDKNFQCPNCSPEDGKGHASYFVRCKNPNTQAVWAIAAAEPEWHKNARLDTQTLRLSQSLDQLPPKNLPPTIRKRGRPRKEAVQRKEASAIMESDGGSFTTSGKRRRTEEPDGEPAPQSSKRRRMKEPVKGGNRNTMDSLRVTPLSKYWLGTWGK